MKTDKNLRESLFTMFDAMFGDNRLNFAFPNNKDFAYLQAYQNNNPRPAVKTLLYYYVDNIDEWKGARHAGQMSLYDRNENKSTQEMMRQFDCVVDIYSKIPGMAMDAMSFLVAVLRGDRWEDLMLTDGWFLGKESVSGPIPVRDIENSTWTSRSRCRIKMNYRDSITIYEQLLELQMPTIVDDMNEITPITGVAL